MTQERPPEPPMKSNDPRPVPQVEMTELFYSHIEDSGQLPEGADARDAASAVLCTLLRRVSRGEAKDFVEALPPALHGLLQKCAVHRAEEPESFDLHGFLERVGSHMGVDESQADTVARAVFKALHESMANKEVDDVESQLPPDLKAIWRHP